MNDGSGGSNRRQERIFASRLCRASDVTEACKRAKLLFTTGNADDYVIAHTIILRLAGPKSRQFSEMEVGSYDSSQTNTN